MISGKIIWKILQAFTNFVLQSTFMKDKFQQDLAQIRNMMEQSTRFISLSGTSGISAGIIALAGAAVAYYLFNKSGINYFDGERNMYPQELVKELIILALLVLASALAAGIYFTVRKSRRNKLSVWNKASKNLVTALFIPLITGGIFCLILLYHGLFYLIAPATLIFYGLALINAGKYTFGDITNLGYVEILLGLLSSVFTGYGLLSWAIGFGVLHIIYGIVMYRKYENTYE